MRSASLRVPLLAIALLAFPTAVARAVGSHPDADALLAAAERHRLHGERDAAHAALDRALATDANAAFAHYARARLLLDEGRFAAGLAAVDEYLAMRPRHAAAHALRGRALAHVGRHRDAAEAYTDAIRFGEPPSPDHYRERARVLAEADPPEIAEAIAGLEEGLARTDAPLSLELYALDLELCDGNLPAARDRLDRITGSRAETERWLALNGLRILGRCCADDPPEPPPHTP